MEPDVSFQDQFQLIDSCHIDVSTTQTTDTLQRDLVEKSSNSGMTFSVPYIYGGKVFYGIKEFVDCAEKDIPDASYGLCKDIRICVRSNTVNAQFVWDHFHRIEHEQELDYSGALIDNLLNETCNVIVAAPTTFLRQLYDRQLKQQQQQVQLAENTNSTSISDHSYYNFTKYRFSKLYGRDPLTMVTKDGDYEFGDLVNWVAQGLLIADLYNITSATADNFNFSYKGDARMFRNVIREVGNFGEIYNRSFSFCAGSKLSVDRVNIGEGSSNVCPAFIHRQLGGINSYLYDTEGGWLYPFPLGNLELEGENVLEDTSSRGRQPPSPNGTLTKITNSKSLRCGVVGSSGGDGGRPGFVEWNESSIHGWIGMDVDYCQGLSAALFDGLSDKNFLDVVYFESLESSITALQNGTIDVLPGVPYTNENNLNQNLAFSNVYYYSKGCGSGLGSPLMDETIQSNNGGNCDKFAIATREDDSQWTGFVRLIAMCVLYAEDNQDILQDDYNKMPLFNMFGDTYKFALRNTIRAIGHYGQMYERNIEVHHPRDTSRNRIVPKLENEEN